MTCPASSTAVFSLLPVPKRMPSNSALESASGPSDKSRSRGLSSGGSCLIVYLRASTTVFYIIQPPGIRLRVSARCSLQSPFVSISERLGVKFAGWDELSEAIDRHRFYPLMLVPLSQGVP